MNSWDREREDTKIGNIFFYDCMELRMYFWLWIGPLAWIWKKKKNHQWKNVTKRNIFFYITFYLFHYYYQGLSELTILLLNASFFSEPYNEPKGTVGSWPLSRSQLCDIYGKLCLIKYGSPLLLMTAHC